MRELCADLHIHTCLSPCAEREMSPPEVVRRGRERGLHVIGICDHNTAENAEAVIRAAEDTGLAVIGGMEISSREEVHVLGLFGDVAGLRSAQGVVYENLVGENDPDAFGEQLIMNERGEVVGRSDRLLLGATDLPVHEVVRTIHRLGGVAIAAHVDRPSFSIVSQLGFIPMGLGLDGVEVCAEHRPPYLGEGLPVVRSSDAHRPQEIGSRYTRFLLERPTASEIGLALRGIRGRRIVT
jgi:PHP family Zn ribbon phosphoesterase